MRYATTSQNYYMLYYVERPKEGFKLKKTSKETQQLIAMKLAHEEITVVAASEPMGDELYWKIILINTYSNRC